MVWKAALKTWFYYIWNSIIPFRLLSFQVHFLLHQFCLLITHSVAPPLPPTYLEHCISMLQFSILHLEATFFSLTCPPLTYKNRKMWSELKTNLTAVVQAVGYILLIKHCFWCSFFQVYFRYVLTTCGTVIHINW